MKLTLVFSRCGRQKSLEMPVWLAAVLAGQRCTSSPNESFDNRVTLSSTSEAKEDMEPALFIFPDGDRRISVNTFDKVSACKLKKTSARDTVLLAR